jgi:hypothetical protein
MKNSIFSFLVFFSISILACNSGNKNDQTQKDNTDTLSNQNLKLQVYYFHATNRCATCQSIEDNVRKVIENNFKDLVAKGEINFKVLCVDDAANKALAEKYEAAGAALHLVKYENGKEMDNDLTEFAFTNIHKENGVFLNSLRDTIQYFVK